MPPKKRKTDDSNASSKKKAKTAAKDGSKDDDLGASPSGLAPNGQPTNKELPFPVVIAKKPDGCVRIASWNICGLAACQKKGFKRYIEAEDPDIIILNETKLNEVPVDPVLMARFPHCTWVIADKKGYSGLAVLSKIPPLSVITTLPGHPEPASVKGRIATLEFASCYLVATYVVNAGTGLKTLDAKNLWNKYFTLYIRELDRKKPVIWAGDLNVAPTEMDLANPKTNWNKTPGYTEAETSAFRQKLTANVDDPRTFIDVWRHLHPTERHYTYFSYRFNCRTKGIGWRLDMFVVSARWLDRVKMCEIRSDVYGASDHCPVTMEVEGDL
ncbi:hypothetical protein FISHEDRAFT_52866 [Fistulina hepatica ATCC 64428]|nr:hypothetical protein FISHEDRAFT_52866 [Fistulina hepatica ATCC 64428]